MAIPIRLILFACVLAIVEGQFPDVDTGVPVASKRLTGRFAPRQTSRIASTSTPNTHKIRRPIPLKSRPVSSDAYDIPSSNLRQTRPVFIPPSPPKESSTLSPQALQQDQPIKPVSEEHDDEQEEIAQAISQPSAPYIPSSFYSGQSLNQARPDNQINQYRPVLPSLPSVQEQQYIAPVQYRPPKPVKLRKPIEEIQEVRNPASKQQLQLASSPKKSIKSEYRGKKPVAQVIRRWREDNADGSITWGFENDDGSYKEEVIGIDCVTRGKYGYVDPDGLRREYTYETGIRCDEQKQEEEEEGGFVDYQENKLVLPNGKTIDLSSMGKKQSRRPSPIYRN